MSDLYKNIFVTLCWLAVAFMVTALVLLLVSGCATLYEPIVDHALAQSEKIVTDRIEELIHEVATRPPPPLPPMGSTWTDYGVWGGSVGMGALAVLVDRRRYHRKKGGSS